MRVVDDDLGDADPGDGAAVAGEDPLSLPGGDSSFRVTLTRDEPIAVGLRMVSVENSIIA